MDDLIEDAKTLPFTGLIEDIAFFIESRISEPLQKCKGFCVL